MFKHDPNQSIASYECFKKLKTHYKRMNCNLKRLNIKTGVTFYFKVDLEW